MTGIGVGSATAKATCTPPTPAHISLLLLLLQATARTADVQPCEPGVKVQLRALVAVEHNSRPAFR